MSIKHFHQGVPETFLIVQFRIKAITFSSLSDLSCPTCLPWPSPPLNQVSSSSCFSTLVTGTRDSFTHPGKAGGAGVCGSFLQGRRCLQVSFFLPFLSLAGQMLLGAVSDTLHLVCQHCLPCLSVLLQTHPTQLACPNKDPSKAATTPCGQP